MYKDLRRVILTEFGKLLRIIRINCGDSAREMAKKLNMSPSYLSTIENGKRKIPADMEDLLIRAYNLSERDKEKIRKAMLESSSSVKIDLTDFAEKKKEIILEMSRDEIDDDTFNKIYEIIKNRPKN